MLADMYKTLLQLSINDNSEEKKFINAVASCGYYDYKVFSKASSLVKQWGMINEKEQVQFESFNESIKLQIEKIAQEEEELGEAPDEFLDPLLMTVMDDPVLLPTSNSILDRATIEQHLLNDKTDPFNREHLTADMLVPQTELKERIEKWKKGGKA